MKSRNLLFGFIIIVLFLPWSDNTYSSSVCVETGSGGELTRGKISREQFESLLEELKTAPDNASLFLVQNDNGYYAKVCNTPDQIEHFEKKFHPGKWKGPKKVMRDEIDKFINKNGVIRINKTKGGWLVYT